MGQEGTSGGDVKYGGEAEEDSAPPSFELPEDLKVGCRSSRGMFANEIHQRTKRRNCYFALLARGVEPMQATTLATLSSGGTLAWMPRASSQALLIFCLLL